MPRLNLKKIIFIMSFFSATACQQTKLNQRKFDPIIHQDADLEAASRFTQKEGNKEVQYELNGLKLAVSSHETLSNAEKPDPLEVGFNLAEGESNLSSGQIIRVRLSENIKSDTKKGVRGISLLTDAIVRDNIAFGHLV